VEERICAEQHQQMFPHLQPALAPAPTCSHICGFVPKTWHTFSTFSSHTFLHIFVAPPGAGAVRAVDPDKSGKFPWISVLPCQPHVISLLLKDIAKDEAVSKVIKEEGLLVSWFSNHHLPLAILRSHARNKFGKTMALIKAAATRFGTNTLVGERLLQLRGCLQGTVVDEQYVKQNYKDAPGDAEEGGKGATAKRYAPAPPRRQAAESQQTQTPDPNRKRRSDTPPTTHLFVCEHWHTPGSTAPAPRRLQACAGR
jgi:hypothetical protein